MGGGHGGCDGVGGSFGEEEDDEIFKVIFLGFLFDAI